MPSSNECGSNLGSKSGLTVLTFTGVLTMKAVNFRPRRSFSVFSDLNKDSRQCWKCYNLVLRFWTQSALGNPPMQDRTFFAGIGLLQLKRRLYIKNREIKSDEGFIDTTANPTQRLKMQNNVPARSDGRF